jgi:hypothetical protein
LNGTPLINKRTQASRSLIDINGWRHLGRYLAASQ